MRLHRSDADDGTEQNRGLDSKGRQTVAVALYEDRVKAVWLNSLHTVLVIAPVGIDTLETGVLERREVLSTTMRARRHLGENVVFLEKLDEGQRVLLENHLHRNTPLYTFIPSFGRDIAMTHVRDLSELLHAARRLLEDARRLTKSTSLAAFGCRKWWRILHLHDLLGHDRITKLAIATTDLWGQML